MTPSLKLLDRATCNMKLYYFNFDGVGNTAVITLSLGTLNAPLVTMSDPTAATEIRHLQANGWVVYP